VVPFPGTHQAASRRPALCTAPCAPTRRGSAPGPGCRSAPSGRCRVHRAQPHRAAVARLLNPPRSATELTTRICLGATTLLHRFKRTRQTQIQVHRTDRFPTPLARRADHVGSQGSCRPALTRPGYFAAHARAVPGAAGAAPREAAMRGDLSPGSPKDHGLGLGGAGLYDGREKSPSGGVG
jgi:hypothetical protein